MHVANEQGKMSTEEEIKTEISLVPEETALVLIEFQNEFTTEGGALHDAVKECMEETGTLKNARKVMDAARSAGCKIIHLPIMYEEVRRTNVNHVRNKQILLYFSFRLSYLSSY